MTDRRDDPLDEVIADFRRVRPPGRPDDSALLSRLAAPVGGDGQPPPGPSRPARRSPMLPALRYAPAAAVVLSALGWLALTAPAPIALAEVIRAAEQHKLVRYRLHQSTVDRQNGPAEGTSTVYVDLTTPRLRIETGGTTLNDVLAYSSVMVQDNRKDRLLALLSQELIVAEAQARDETQAKIIRMVREKGMAGKSARLYRVSPDDIKPFSDLNKDGSLLDGLRAFQSAGGVAASREKLDGRDAIRYRLVSAGKTSTLWVDPETKLPVRIEHEMTDPAPRIALNHWTYTNFEWDPKAPDAALLFSVEPPAGYAVEDHTADR